VSSIHLRRIVAQTLRKIRLYQLVFSARKLLFKISDHIPKAVIVFFKLGNDRRFFTQNVIEVKFAVFDLLSDPLSNHNL